MTLINTKSDIKKEAERKSLNENESWKTSQRQRRVRKEERRNNEGKLSRHPNTDDQTLLLITAIHVAASIAHNSS